jgi:hypothetical protein
MLVGYTVVHGKIDRAAKLKSVDTIRAELREAVEANRSEVSDTDIGRIMELGS